MDDGINKNSPGKRKMMLMSTNYLPTALFIFCVFPSWERMERNWVLPGMEFIGQYITSIHILCLAFRR